MSTNYHTFIQLLFIGIVALFPVVNPIGSALIANHFFSELTRPERRRVALKIALYAFFLCTVTLLIGHWILQLFGLSIPVIQVAGGILICKTGWEFLSSDQSSETEAGNAHAINKDKLQEQLFFPITFPITVGGGVMAVLFTLGAQSSSINFFSYVLNSIALIFSIVIICALVYVFYVNTQTILRYAGSNGQKIINHIIAFLTFCVGLQIAVTGIKALAK